MAARANRANTPAASFAHLCKFFFHSSATPFSYLHNFLSLNNLRLVPLDLRDSEICDPCLHFLLLLLLCLLHLMLGVADGLIDMLVQELKELVDVPATAESHNYTLSPQEKHSHPVNCHRLPFGELKQIQKGLFKPVRNNGHIILGPGRRR